MTPEEYKVDKSKFRRGPWDNEPDRVEWRSHGFPCLIVRPNHGALCGYVAVPRGHPWFEKPYRDVDATVHGRLTYSDHCKGNICHAPKGGEPDNVWWLGFDCTHWADRIPSAIFESTQLQANLTEALVYGDSLDFPTYRDIRYVTEQVNLLAEQAKEVLEKG